MTQEREENITFIVVFIIVAVIAAALYFSFKKDNEFKNQTRSETPRVPETLKLPAGEREAIIRYPVPEPVKKQEELKIQTIDDTGEIQEAVVKVEALPELDQSDETLESELKELVGLKRFKDLFLVKALVRHFVVTIDNMTTSKLPQRFRFTNEPPGKFTVKTQDIDNAVLDPKNYERYGPFVALADAVDLRKFVSVYVRFYPLFQEAYVDLGYPGRYFNDRFVEVIDHLLAAPRVQDPIQLVRPKVFYKFADPKLEALSAGQKIMIRIGPENAERVKVRLRELRRYLTSLQGKWRN